MVCLRDKVASVRDFCGGPVAKTPPSHCREPGFDPRSGNRCHTPQLKILHAATKTWHSQRKKEILTQEKGHCGWS